MKLTKESLAALAHWNDEEKADVMALFDSIKEKDDTISALKAKEPKDSQKVVESVEYEKLIQAQRERDTLAQQLREKLESANVEINLDPLEAFPDFSKLFGA